MPNILIVDGEPLQRLLIREILNEDASLRFFEAASGALALGLAQLYPPHTIILGLRVPSLGNLHLYERVCAGCDGRPVPLIVTTAGPRTDPNFKALTETRHTILIKPFEAEDLQAAVRRALMRAGVPSPAS